MRKPPKINGSLLKSLSATIAYFQLCRELRRNQRVRSHRQWLVVVQCHHERDIRSVTKACKFYLFGNQHARQMHVFGDDQTVINIDEVSSWKDKSGRIVLPRNAKDQTNLFIVCGPGEMLSADLALAADSVIQLPEVQESHLIAALKLSSRGKASDDDITTLLGLDLQTLQNAFRKDRTTREALTCLSAMPPREVATSKKATRTLEQIHGMGEAAEWGYRLAADLASWKDGSLAWHDIESSILLSGPPGTGKTSFASALANTCGVELVVGSYATWQASGHFGLPPEKWSSLK